MVLPLAFEESSFDYYDSDEHIYIITEKEVQNCLMSKKDDFINRKIILEEDLKVKNYRDYFVIGYFNIYNDIFGEAIFSGKGILYACGLSVKKSFTAGKVFINSIKSDISLDIIVKNTDNLVIV
jgi:hypothetical protein